MNTRSMLLKLVVGYCLLTSAHAQTTNYLVDFEGATETKTSYASGTVTLSGLQWNLTEALIGTSASDPKNGARSARMRTNDVAVMTMLEDITNGAGTVSFLHARYGTDAASFVALDYSTDGGSLWVNAGTASVDSTTLQLYSTNINISGNVRLRLRKTGSSPASARANVDDITVLSSGPPPSPTTNVQFTASSASIGEAGGAYTVTVYKTLASGDVSGSVALSGTAAETADYTIDTTNFTMNGATTSATFVVTIVDDGATEANETVILTLTNVTGGTISSPSVFTLTITDNDGPPPSSGAVWINEFNYDPPGTDSNEFVELAGPAGVDLADYRIVLYNGSGGAPYATILPSGLIPDEGCGYGALAFDAVGLQNGPPDGIALAKVDAGVTSLVQFLSYEGTFTGVGGPADGVSSTDVGTQNSSLDTLQLSGTGTNYADFTWVSNTVSRGVLNVGQTISPCGGGGPATNVKFTAASASIGEAGGSYTVTVFKTLATGDVSGSVALSGTAATPADYTIDTTNFTMNGAVTSATFVVTIVDDGATESDETVILTLTNVVGGDVSSPSVFTLTITDNDVPPVTPEGILSFRFNTAPYLPVTTNEAGITVSVMSLTSGTIETNVTTGTYFPDEPYIEETGGWTASTQDLAKAFQFTVTPDPGMTVTITGISFRAYGTAAGPSAFGASIDGVSVFSADLPDSTLQVVSNTIAPVAFTNAFVVQIQGWTNGSRATAGTGTFRIDDVVLFGTISSGSGYSQEQEDYIVLHWGSLGAYTGDAADDDGDGFLNVEEFIAGTIPVLPSGASSFFRSIAISNGAARIVVVPSVTGRQYRLWSAPSLYPTQTWSEIAGPISGTGADLQLTDPVVGTTGLYRTSVELTNP